MIPFGSMASDGQGDAFAGLGPFDAALGVFAALLVAVIAVVFPLERLAIAWSGVVPLVAAVAVFVVLLVFYGWRKEPRLTEVLRTAIWTLVLSNLCILPLYLPMRHAAPLADPLLARLDHACGFDDGLLVAWVSSHALVRRASSFVYDTLTLLCLLSVMATSFMGRVARAENVLLAIVVGVAVTLVAAYFFPAIGPWETSGFLPSGDQASCGRVIRVLRESGPFTVDLANPDPIIATPSWHVILAVLAALALRPMKWVGPFACVWAGLIVLSTLTTGWHYLADVVAGFAVALGSYTFSARWLRPRLVPARASGAGTS